MRSKIRAAVAFCLVGFSGLSALSFQGGQGPPVPKSAREPGGTGDEGRKTAYNAWTGDARIRLRRFHAIVFLPATASDTDGLTDAKRTRDQIADLTESFSKDYVSRASGKGVDFFKESGFRATPQPEPLIGAGATWKNLDDLIGRLDIQKEDVLFVWVQTHGQTSKEKGGATLFDAESTPIDRKMLRGKFTTMAGVEPWLTVFITDRCSIPPAMSGQGLPPEGDRGEPHREIWRALYFGHKGVIDIDSSSAGEFAAIDGTNGSIFARAFRETLDEKVVPRDEINQDDDPFIRWDHEFLPALKKHTSELFKVAIEEARRVDPDFLKGQETQTPRIDFSHIQVNERRFGANAATEPKSEAAR